jgi:aspartate aminotransferase/aminotransferase
MNIALAGGRPVAYPLETARHYEPDFDLLAARAAHPRAKAIVVNSPSNPTGAVHAPAVLERVLEIASANDLHVISDEVYEKIVFDGAHVSPATLDPDDRVVSIFSFSKTYAMTGWRVGYAVGPPAVMELVAKLQEALVACAPAVSQKAAEAALLGSQAVVSEMAGMYRTRRSAVLRVLAESGIPAVEPAGSFYVLADVSAFALDTRALAKWLVPTHGVAVAPGETFGALGAGRVRLSIASDQAALEEGARRLAQGALAWREGGGDGRA